MKFKAYVALLNFIEHNDKTVIILIFFKNKDEFFH